MQCSDDALEHATVAYKNSKTFRIEATEGATFCKVGLDKVNVDYLIKHGQKISDFIFVCCNKKQHDKYYPAYFFVELKGGDIISAVEQIENTITNFRTQHSAPLDRISGYIVSTGVPGKANQKFQKEQERLRKKDIRLYKGTDQYTKRYP
jgi:hypothetical protein